MNNKKYEIIILCGANPYKGPGIIALDLQQILKKNGHSVIILSNEYFCEIDNTILSLVKKKSTVKKILLKFHPLNILLKLKKIFNRQRFSKYFMFSLSGQSKCQNSKKVLAKIQNKPDIIIYMFSHNFLNPIDLKNIHNKTGSRFFFWMMDSEAMTGGCHFTWECENYKNNCGKCPGINSRNEKDKTFRNIIQKKDIFQSIDIQPIYVTELQKQMLSESFIFKNIKSFKAYIPVDENKYLKNTKYKQKYGLPENKKLIFFAANEIDDERKGMRFLYNALNILNDKLPITKKEKILLIVAGNRFEKINIKLPFDYVHLGYLSQISFAEVMCSSDIFICPSIEDTGPMVINQSLMCGTPVVAFNMGVAKDFIKNGVTGYKAEIRNENELANGIYSLLIMPTNELKLISKNCRETALKNFSLNSVLNQFNEILNSIN